MDYQHLEKTAMCYRCIHKELCKTVYQADDLGIQESKWNCPKFTEEKPQGRWIPVSERLPDKDGCYLVTLEGVEDYELVDDVDIARFIFSEKDDCNNGFQKAYIVTAWQELPEPYEK